MTDKIEDIRARHQEGIRAGVDADRAYLLAEVDRLREALREWDALIKHQYSGTRDAMSDMQYAALNTKRILDELESKP